MSKMVKVLCFLAIIILSNNIVGSTIIPISGNIQVLAFNSFPITEMHIDINTSKGWTRYEIFNEQPVNTLVANRRDPFITPTTNFLFNLFASTSSTEEYEKGLCFIPQVATNGQLTVDVYQANLKRMKALWLGSFNIATYTNTKGAFNGIPVSPISFTIGITTSNNDSFVQGGNQMTAGVLLKYSTKFNINKINQNNPLLDAPNVVTMEYTSGSFFNNMSFTTNSGQVHSIMKSGQALPSYLFELTEQDWASGIYFLPSVNKITASSSPSSSAISSSTIGSFNIAIYNSNQKLLGTYETGISSLALPITSCNFIAYQLGGSITKASIPWGKALLLKALPSIKISASQFPNSDSNIISKVFLKMPLQQITFDINQTPSIRTRCYVVKDGILPTCLQSLTKNDWKEGIIMIPQVIKPSKSALSHKYPGYLQVTFYKKNKKMLGIYNTLGDSQGTQYCSGIVNNANNYTFGGIAGANSLITPQIGINFNQAILLQYSE